MYPSPLSMHKILHVDIHLQIPFLPPSCLALGLNRTIFHCCSFASSTASSNIRMLLQDPPLLSKSVTKPSKETYCSYAFIRGGCSEISKNLPPFAYTISSRIFASRSLRQIHHSRAMLQKKPSWFAKPHCGSSTTLILHLCRACSIKCLKSKSRGGLALASFASKLMPSGMLASVFANISYDIRKTWASSSYMIAKE